MYGEALKLWPERGISEKRWSGNTKRVCILFFYFTPWFDFDGHIKHGMCVCLKIKINQKGNI